MFQTSIIELSKSAYKKNLRFLKGKIGKNTKFSSVIKGNSYGHGIEVFVPMAEECGVRHFSVFDAYEALRTLNSRTCESDIMIMGAIDNNELEWAIENDISFYIFDLDRLNAAFKAAKRVNKPARIHLKLETGLNRMGLDEDALDEVFEKVKRNQKQIDVVGVCTHLAGAESSSNYLRIRNQINKYNRIVEYLKEKSIDVGLKHAACSAALFNYPETTMDMVRVGIADRKSVV